MLKKHLIDFGGSFILCLLISTPHICVASVLGEPLTGYNTYILGNNSITSDFQPEFFDVCKHRNITKDESGFNLEFIQDEKLGRMLVRNNYDQKVGSIEVSFKRFRSKLTEKIKTEMICLRL